MAMKFILLYSNNYLTPQGTPLNVFSYLLCLTSYFSLYLNKVVRPINYTYPQSLFPSFLSSRSSGKSQPWLNLNFSPTLHLNPRVGRGWRKTFNSTDCSQINSWLWTPSGSWALPNCPLTAPILHSRSWLFHNGSVIKLRQTCPR